MRYATGVSKAEYRKEITAVFRRNTSRGFSDWRQCEELCDEICYFLRDAAHALVREGRYADLFDITNRCFMKWSSTDKDDSNGETQYFCACVQDNWATVYEKGRVDISHATMLKWFVKQLEEHTVIDYMEDDLYDFLLSYFKGEEELALKKAMLEHVMEDPEIPEYHVSVLQEYYLRVLADMKVPIEDIRGIAAESGGYCIEAVLAKIEVEYGNLDAAIALYEKRIAERPDPYWSNESRRALIDIYRKSGDKEKEFEQLHGLLWANVGNSEIFLEYKQHFTEEDWPQEWDRILEALDNQPKGARWYAIEGRFDILMDVVEQEQNDAMLDTYTELEGLYPERCMKIRVECVRADAARANKRAHYRWLARKLKRISRYAGGTEVARGLAAEFAAAYPRRSAMLDELWSFLV